MSTCNSCGAPVEWYKTESGKSMPIDFAPDPAGNLILVGGPDARLHMLAADETPPPDTNRYRSHFATCPHAAEHRRRRG